MSARGDLGVLDHHGHGSSRPSEEPTFWPLQEVNVMRSGGQGRSHSPTADPIAQFAGEIEAAPGSVSSFAVGVDRQRPFVVRSFVSEDSYRVIVVRIAHETHPLQALPRRIDRLDRRLCGDGGMGATAPGSASVARRPGVGPAGQPPRAAPQDGGPDRSGCQPLLSSRAGRSRSSHMPARGRCHQCD
jgi:hypothetical protein